MHQAYIVIIIYEYVLSGNTLLNLFGCGSCINVTLGATATPDIVLIALTFGLTIFAVVSVSTSSIIDHVFSHFS